jgi:hypothetical protein
MHIDDYFSATYQDARRKFVDAADGVKAQIRSYRLAGHEGPDGSELFLDLAEINSGESNLLMIISGTHGVEGFCGSGCQTGYLLDRIYEAPPKKVTVALVHALNPFGFAWLRRVNEDNVDINRNFHNFAAPLPPSDAYDVLHHWLVPADWDGPARKKADAEIDNYVQKQGLAAYQAAVSGGQYSRADGLFFGGTRETWSNRTFRQIMTHLITPSIRRVAVLDLHTGLGPAGYGEPICVGHNLDEYLRARRWFGPEVTSTAKGDSTSALVSGSLAEGVLQCTEKIESTYLALEYGTVPMKHVLTALRADHWLHARGNLSSCLGNSIKAEIRKAFFIDEPWWKAAVYGRFVDMTLRAARGLAEA